VRRRALRACGGAANGGCIVAMAPLDLLTNGVKVALDLSAHRLYTLLVFTAAWAWSQTTSPQKLGGLQAFPACICHAGPFQGWSRHLHMWNAHTEQ
jgi:hypothetical protein